ncbi:hypothetical protein B0H19DRAFT_1068229 [Mycena capillaripes]|nr:hypothetical protein B0H19DRAFT_1068229 [Mycena capillaripes]
MAQLEGFPYLEVWHERRKRRVDDGPASLGTVTEFGLSNRRRLSKSRSLFTLRDSARTSFFPRVHPDIAVPASAFTIEPVEAIAIVIVKYLAIVPRRRALRRPVLRRPIVPPHVWPAEYWASSDPLATHLTAVGVLSMIVVVSAFALRRALSHKMHYIFRQPTSGIWTSNATDDSKSDVYTASSR